MKTAFKKVFKWMRQGILCVFAIVSWVVKAAMLASLYPVGLLSTWVGGESVKDYVSGMPAWWYHVLIEDYALVVQEIRDL